MTFQELLNSQVFFTIFIHNDIFFDSLKDKFPDILADLTSSRNNPNCSCKNRVKAYLQSKLENEANYFNELLNHEEIKKIIETKKEEIKNSQHLNPTPNNPMFNHPIYNMGLYNANGRIFEIGKNEEDWRNLCRRIQQENIIFRSFSVVEKEDKLIVYFI